MQRISTTPAQGFASLIVRSTGAALSTEASKQLPETSAGPEQPLAMSSTLMQKSPQFCTASSPPPRVNVSVRMGLGGMDLGRVFLRV